MHSHWILAVILGLVQGITEFLPVSSSGHLILVSWYLEGAALPLVLTAALHLGTLFTLFIYFWRDWFNLAYKLFDRIFRKKPSFEADVLFPSLVVSAIPVGLAGLLAKDFIEEVFHRPEWVVGPLMLVGFLLWWIDASKPDNRRLDSLTIKDGAIIGLMQTLALIPGVSRSGITMLTARYVGFSREDSARFSFLMAVPPMLGASLIHLPKIAGEISDPLFSIGILSSCFFGCLTVRFLLRFLRNYGFFTFAVYRFLLGVVILSIISK